MVWFDSELLLFFLFDGLLRGGLLLLKGDLIDRMWSVDVYVMGKPVLF